MRKTTCLVLIAAFVFLVGLTLRFPRPVLAQDTTITDPAVASCPGEDKPGEARKDYPFPAERPTKYLSSTAGVSGKLQMGSSCSTDPAFQSCYGSVGGSHTVRFTYLDSPCPQGFNQDSSGCYLDTTVEDGTIPPLVPGTYYVHDLAGCWQPQTIDTGQGCTISGSLQCTGGSSTGLQVSCTGGSLGVVAPSPGPTPANKESDFRNGLPVAGKSCAREESTPIRFPEGFCVTGGQSGQLRLMPNTVQAPFAQETGQSLVGVMDVEHFSFADISHIYDAMMGLPGVNFPVVGRVGFPGAKGISAGWEISGPVSRLAPQLEQDRLRHEFLGWLCEEHGDQTQGRNPKNLNTRYNEPTFIIHAPLLGTQVASQMFIDNCKKLLVPESWCVELREFFLKNPTHPINAKPCEIYKGTKWPNPSLWGIEIPIPDFLKDLDKRISVNDVYVQKMASQCKYPNGTAIPSCTKKSMYIPNFVEQAIWDRVPLFANEESKGEIEFKVCGSDKTVKIETSVPQVFRLASASAFLQQMLLSASDSAKYKKISYQSAEAGPLECPGCPDAQAGPPDTETFIDYKNPYNSGSRGKVNYQGGGSGTSAEKKGISVYNNVPFLLSIWYQTAGGPFGVFNILRPYRPLDQFVTGLFQPTGKPFASDGQFLDTPGGDPVQYEGANIQSDVWKLLFSKLAGVWNAKNWIMQSVAPY